MWPFRIPPFVGHPGIPDPGLSTGEWLTVLLTAAIAAAAVAQAIVAYRLWRLQASIEDERKKVDIIVDLAGTNQDAILRVMLVAARGVFIRVVKVEAFDSTLPAGKRVWHYRNSIGLRPYEPKDIKWRTEWLDSILPLWEAWPPQTMRSILLGMTAFYYDDRGKPASGRQFRYNVEVHGTSIKSVELVPESQK